MASARCAEVREIPSEYAPEVATPRTLSRRHAGHSYFVAERLIHGVNLIHFGPPELKRRRARLPKFVFRVHCGVRNHAWRRNPTQPMRGSFPASNNVWIVDADRAIRLDDMAAALCCLPGEPLGGQLLAFRGDRAGPEKAPKIFLPFRAFPSLNPQSHLLQLVPGPGRLL